MINLVDQILLSQNRQDYFPPNVDFLSVSKIKSSHFALQVSQTKKGHALLLFSQKELNHSLVILSYLQIQIAHVLATLPSYSEK